ncbi:MAG: hypothetical protein E6I64_05060 [Chloroflexi bacterium]|nr:MAG: hypothetical protein E6I64_05060 [Chloroflexota bacterium]
MGSGEPLLALRRRRVGRRVQRRLSGHVPMSERPALHAPSPSIWPVTLALGVGLAVVGLVTVWPVLAAGAILIALALVGWIAQALEESG